MVVETSASRSDLRYVSTSRQVNSEELNVGEHKAMTNSGPV